MIKVRRSHDRLIFNMGIQCLGKRSLYWDAADYTMHQFMVMVWEPSALLSGIGLVSTASFHNGPVIWDFDFASVVSMNTTACGLLDKESICRCIETTHCSYGITIMYNKRTYVSQRVSKNSMNSMNIASSILTMIWYIVWPLYIIVWLAV